MLFKRFTNDPDFCFESDFADDVTVSHVQDGINDIRHNVTHIHRHSVLKSALYTPSLSSNTIITCSIPSWRKGRGPLESNILSAALCLSVVVRGALAASPRSLMYSLLASQHSEEMLPITGVTRGHKLKPSWTNLFDHVCQIKVIKMK